jgi:hypothetical protein
MTEGFNCTADARCWYPAPSAKGIDAQYRRQALLAQMRQSLSLTVRAAGWLLTQIHQRGSGADRGEFRRRGRCRGRCT